MSDEWKVDVSAEAVEAVLDDLSSGQNELDAHSLIIALSAARDDAATPSKGEGE